MLDIVIVGKGRGWMFMEFSDINFCLFVFAFVKVVLDKH